MAVTRRADFLMTLAYATDLATGHSRDFALRSCVLAMRLAEVAGLDDETRRNVYHQALLRYIGCNADTHLLASAFGDEIALRRDLPRIDIGNKSELAETIVRAITRTFADAPPAELAEAVERGLAEAMQVSVPILSGHCEVAQRIAERIGLSGRDPRESRPALRALGRKGNAARPVGQCREASGPAGDAGAGCHRADRGAWLRDHEGDDRQARRRRLRAGTGRSFPRACRTTDGGPRRAGRPRDDPGAGARCRMRCSTRRPARKPIWRSPT